jgi:hypothetical protein
VQRLAVALAHASVILMICKAGLFRWLTARLAAVGQMALTNYLSDTLICTTLFNGYGFGLFGQLQRYQIYWVVLAIWIFQLAVSQPWLRHFRFGPAEWLWRSLTYWKPNRCALPTRFLRSAKPLSQAVGSSNYTITKLPNFRITHYDRYSVKRPGRRSMDPQRRDTGRPSRETVDADE